MRRRQFISPSRRCGGAAAGGARAAGPKVPTHRFSRHHHGGGLGFLDAAFLERLGQLGWTDGRNVAIQYRWADGKNENFTRIAAEFAELKVDVILTSGAAGRRRQSRRPLPFPP